LFFDNGVVFVDKMCVLQIDTMIDRVRGIEIIDGVSEVKVMCR